MNKGRTLLLILVLSLSCRCNTHGQTSIPHNWTRESAGSERIALSNDVQHNGQPVLRFELNKDDKLVSKSKRSEMATPYESRPDVNRYYTFNIYLPGKYFNEDSIPEIVAQWHAQPDFSKGETWRSPPIALSTRNGHWWLTIRWAADSVNTNKTITGIKTVDLGAYEKNRWVNWQFHIGFSYKDDGVMEVWKNKELVFTRNGPNYYNDQKGPFFKFGIYKWGWMNKNVHPVITRRVLYFSDVKIEDGISRK